MTTEIEWVLNADGNPGKTWNPTVGCTIVDSDCTNCYAMRQAARIERMNPDLAHYRGLTKVVNGKPVWTGKVALAPAAKLNEPLRRKKPTTWFVNSMSDLFHEDAPDEWIDRVFAVMGMTPQHTYQILTKRPRRMREYMTAVGDGRRLVTDREGLFSDAGPWPLPNVWLGVSAGDQRKFDARWPELAVTPAAVRFISYEPMLGPLVLGDARPDWLIAGCESIGPRAGRPYDLDWVHAIRDECQRKGVAFFLKQLAVDGRIVSLPDLDGRQWREFPTTEKARAAA